jgi:hypothetical protein
MALIQVPGHLDLDRRSVLFGSGLALAGTLRAAPAPHRRVTFGANRGTFPHFRDAVPLAKCVRVYYDEENVFPLVWPHELADVWVTLSIRPNPGDLLAGRLDAALLALAHTAPLHSELAPWHEAGGNNPRHYPSYITASSVRAMQEYLARLFEGTHVRVGSIICGPANQLADWIGRGLDWYSTDWYDNERYWNKDGTLSLENMAKRWLGDVEVWRKLSGVRRPRLRICESNSGMDSHRANWFGNQAKLLANNNGHRLLTFWHSPERARQGSLSGPWPPSKPVVRRLRWLAEQSSVGAV